MEIANFIIYKYKNQFEVNMKRIWLAVSNWISALWSNVYWWRKSFIILFIIIPMKVFEKC